MKILVSNDDGIRAKGLWVLAESLRAVGDVVVVAPDREQSAISSAITLHHPVRVAKVSGRLTRGIEAYAVEGTPADSVILALGMLLRGEIDMVFSGINEGNNLGNDVFLSGTVGAALQGYFQGLPAVALSVEHADRMPLEVAGKVAALLAKGFAGRAMEGGFLLNVNVPKVPKEEIEGIEVTRLARRSYVDSIEEGHDGKRSYYWIVRGKPEWEVEEGTDLWAIEHRRVSVTALQGDWTEDRRKSLLSDVVTKVFLDLTG